MSLEGQVEGTMTFKRSFTFVLGSVLCLTLVAHSGSFKSLSEAAPTAKVTPSGEGIELEFTEEDGTVSKETLTLYKAGAIRYFSAGMGLEERAAPYPPFPLKLIFVAEPKAYLSRVSVTITDAKGAVQLQVPAEQVTGPWLYVDLPAGTYNITASRDGQDQVKGQVSVEKGGVKTLYLRWKSRTQ
jgi:hypothetical protein